MNLARVIDDRLKPGKSTPIFSIQDHLGKRYVRNDACWARDVDLTCASPYNNYYFGGNLRAGTLFTPSWAALAAHFSYPKGTQVRFVEHDPQPDGTFKFHDRLVIDGSPVGGDTYIVLFDSPLPATIRPAMIPTFNTLKQLSRSDPLILIDQEEKALVADLFQMGPTFTITPISGKRVAFSEKRVNHDSGSPLFAVREDAKVGLIGCLHSASIGPNWSMFISKVTAQMSKMAPTRVEPITFW